ncbi:zinc-binding dehydrogenase [Acidocella sp.]|uniref:zinc-binding dehydrogenase n=1 Tax=Acidocella sp. TaxID=50710 RepID=UPI0026021A7B|nr:zinc-binding dehydrogenase [Acidocella sp.]
MRAVVRRGTALVCEDMADPVPGEGQALVKPLACGICGSDLHVLHTGSAAAFIFGHEYCAEVVDSKRFRPGTRVVAMPFTPGPRGTELIGYSTVFPGGFAERMLLTEELMLEVPNGLEADIAALTEPLAVGAHGVARAQLDKDSVALIIGMGPVGAAVLANLKAQGFGPVIVADFSAARRARAAQMGADIVIDPGQEDPHARWADFGMGGRHDPMAEALGRHAKKRAVIFECVGNPGMLQSIITGAPFGAEILLLGVCLQPDTIVPALAVNKQISIKTAIFYTAEEFARSLHNLAEGVIDGRGLITGHVGLSGVADAFARLAKPDDHMKIMVEPWRD